MHQMSLLLELAYHKLCDEMRDIYRTLCESEVDFVSPNMVMEWAKAHEHSLSYLNHNTLVYRPVFQESHQKALAFQASGGHAYLAVLRPSAT